MKKISKNKIITTFLIIIFTITITVIPVSANNKKVIIGGEPFGLKLYCNGVMVTKFQSVNNKCPAKTCGLMENDIICKINNIPVNSNEQLSNIITNSNGQQLQITVDRATKKLTLFAYPVKNNEGTYFLGVWVRDSSAGIGTITYYDPYDNSYGALGHGICDIDTGGLMISDNVEILKANISSVTKSENNVIGTLNGYFTDDILAKIGKNHHLGVYGKMETIPAKNTVEVGTDNDIQTGSASIYTTVKGTTPMKYDISILEICNKDKNTNKNFIIKITDKELLDKTGGIVQGMSGSPIIQNNKIVGALTHVLIKDPTKGYGIFIENMLAID